MPRVHFYRPITDNEGNIVTDATVRVSDPATGLTTTTPLYDSYAGTVTLPNPWQPTTGIIDFYLDQPQVVNLHVARPGQAETVLSYVDVGGTYQATEEMLSFTLVGLITPQVGTLRYYIDEPSEIVSVRASVGSSSTTGDIVLDVNRGGSTIFTDQGTRPRLTLNEYTTTTTPQSLALAPEDWLTLDVDEAPAGSGASDLVVQIRLRRT